MKYVTFFDLGQFQGHLDQLYYSATNAWKMSSLQGRVSRIGVPETNANSKDETLCHHYVLSVPLLPIAKRASGYESIRTVYTVETD